MTARRLPRPAQCATAPAQLRLPTVLSNVSPCGGDGGGGEGGGAGGGEGGGGEGGGEGGGGEGGGLGTCTLMTW